MSRHRSVAFALLTLLAFSCAAGVAPGPREVPKSLNGLEALASDTFGLAFGGDLEGLKSASRRLGKQWASVRAMVAGDGASAADVAAMDGAIAGLQRAVEGRADPVSLARAANAVGLHMDELFGLYQPVIPPAVLTLDFLGREILIDVTERDYSGATGHTDDLVATWNSLRARVVGAGGAKAAEFFDRQVADLRSALGKEDGEATGRIAMQVLDDVDVLEAVF
jgi:hypothetical protein